jgi:Heparinase II/III-like protein
MRQSAIEEFPTKFTRNILDMRSLFALCVANLLLNFTLQICGAEPSHPLFATDQGGEKSAEKVYAEYTDKEFLDLVPRQSPRSGNPCPGSEELASHWTHWQWDPRKPNEIHWGAFVYPGSISQPKFDLVETLSGKTVRVPYYETKNGRSYIQAEIDNEKRNHLWQCMEALSAGYSTTHNEKYAWRIAIVLDAWANYFPDYFLTTIKNRGEAELVSPGQAAKLNWNVRRASDHNGLAHEWSMTDIIALDVIWNSQSLAKLSLERGYDVRTHIVKDYFLNEGNFLTTKIPVEVATGSNLSGPFYVLAATAVLLDRPDYIEWLDQYLDVTLKQRFVRDGMYPESFGYHKGYANENLGIAQMVSRYFSVHPVNSTLRDVMEKASERLRFLEKAVKAHLTVALPNGDLAPFDDTLNGDAPVRTHTHSTLLPAYGHLALGDGDGREQTQINLQFNDHCNHVHKSNLALTVFSQGQELIGNNRYAHGAGRGFLNGTMSHNTVVIDRKSQDRGNIQVAGNEDHLFTGGDLVLYEPGLSGISLAEVDGRRAYADVPGAKYHRLVVLNTVDRGHPYIIDVFRVAGGVTHDYFLHGSVKFDQTARTSLNLQPMGKTYPLLEEGENWVEPKTENEVANWYGVFRDMRYGRSPGHWDVTFCDTVDAGGIRIHVADEADNQIFLGTSPVASRGNKDRSETIFNFKRPTLMIRRQAKDGKSLDSLFVTVLEPFTGDSVIKEVKRLPLQNPGYDAVALRIIWANGREDTVLVDLSDSDDGIGTVDKEFHLQGRFGLYSETGTVGHTWMIGAREFNHRRSSTDNPFSLYEGNISTVLRRREGAAADVLVTDEILPEGDAWRGRWISLTFGKYHVVPDELGNFPFGIQEQEGISQMFEIDHVERRENKTWIHLTEDPSFTIHDGIVTEQLRPNRSFIGPCRFRISTSRFQ